MKLACALCGRPMDRAAFTIGSMPVGPKCGIKAGFLQLSRKKTGNVRLVGRFRAKQDARGDTLDLFAEVEA